MSRLGICQVLFFHCGISSVSGTTVIKHLKPCKTKAFEGGGDTKPPPKINKKNHKFKVIANTI